MRELKDQLVNALLVVLTAAAVISAALNFQQQKKVKLPDDGAIWVDRNGRVEALHIVPGSPAANRGLRAGDIIVAINGAPVRNALDVTRILVGIGGWRSADYLIHRQGVEVKIPIILGEREPQGATYYQYLVALAYLSIGLFVYFRRGGAPKARHFYILCLASFVLFAFHYTGKLNNFDKVIYWGNVAAGVLAPTIFLHFCLTFPEPGKWFRSRWRIALLYVPGLLLVAAYVGFSSGTIRIAVSLVEIRWMLDRLWLLLMAGLYLTGALVLTFQYHSHREDPIVRQQLKWLRNGALFGVVPFTLFYVLPYVLGAVPGRVMDAMVFSLLLVPLTWAYAILRYRLMDVDVIFQQGYVYTAATLSVIAIFYALILSVWGRMEELNSTALVSLLLIATFIFQPIRKWLQEQFDRYIFYKDRYDYRRTLIEFARELGSETDLDATLNSVADRLRRTLSIQHIAFFLLGEEDGRFYLKMNTGRLPRNGQLSTGDLDLSFLSAEPGKPYLFFERTRHALDVVSTHWPASVRDTIANLDLTYYLPCQVRGRTIAYIGASRTEEDDFLPSDDIELLQTISGYVGIAVENARLYRTLQRKVDEYERLKEFSENIVESINVGILAADLADRVESWNTQMERLTGIPREYAVGRTLTELIPRDLCERFDSVRGETGIHHIYKFALRARSLPAQVAELAAGAYAGGGTNGNGSGTHEVAPDGAAEAADDAILNIAVAPLVSRDLEQIGRLIIFDDITDRTELEQKLVQADKLSSIGLLAAGVAHEVNTPLAVISTYAQMLAKQIPGDDQKSKLLDKIAKQTFRASEIVNSLLNFSRTSTTSYDDVDLNKVLRETVALLEHQLQKAGVSVSLHLEDGMPAIRGNTGKLQQVFLNLVLNARDAMNSGGVLSIRSWSDRGLARVDVSDTGQGIASENLARIYDPFFTTKASRKGTGLGLSVTYGIVKEHGGSIEVQSEVGIGTRFHLELPLSRKPVNV